MDRVTWIAARIVVENYATSESTLLRYAQRGMIGARWDQASAAWLYDTARVRELFLLRSQAEQAVVSRGFGILGEARLGGAPKGRKPPVNRGSSSLRETGGAASHQRRAS